MKKATDALLSDHKMIRKLLEGFRRDNPRYAEVGETLKRVVLSHAWFEDQVFLPAFRNERLFAKRYLDEIESEHKDIDALLALVTETKPEDARAFEAYSAQFRAILDNHLKKEEDALFPIAEKILDNEGLNRLGAEMERRQDEARKLFS